MPEASPSEDHRQKKKKMSLKQICFRSVRRHFSALSCDAVTDLPVPLIKDLLPHLTVCQLDELQPVLNQRGISTYSGWMGVLQDMNGPANMKDLHTEEEAKQKVMSILFTLVFYGYTNPFIRRNITNLNTPSFLSAAAKSVRHFLLIPKLDKPLQGLTAEQRPLLDLLEKRIERVDISQCIDLTKRKTQTALYVLHRLLDHGEVKELVVFAQTPIVLAWLLHGRGSQYVNPELRKLMLSRDVSRAAAADADEAGCSSGASEDQDDHVPPCKRPKLVSVPVEEEECGKASFAVDPQVLRRAFTPCDDPSAGVCPRGQIECLKVRQCGVDSLRLLISALPTFFCLRSLTLQSFLPLSDSDVSDLAAALRRLSDSSRSSLAELSVSILPHAELLEMLLDSSPSLTSLHVEVQTVTWGPAFTSRRPRTAEANTSDLLLKKLTVKVTEDQTNLLFVTSVLRRSPRLVSFHAAGMRLPTGSSQSLLLNVLTESNPSLKSLILEDMKLSDCLPAILHLLRNSRLEELRFNDCRLLEKWSDKEGSLQQLVAALKAAPSLRTLGLAQNRLAKNVCVLAELFSGSSPSSVKQLDVSSNFIQPAELLDFAERLRSQRPPHQLTLNLGRNPGDRDPDTWNAALRTLRRFCVVLFEGWVSTGTMADYISNM